MLLRLTTSVRSSARPARVRFQHRAAADLWPVAVAGGAVMVALLATYPIRGFTLPIGPDSPVYAWWAALAEHEGLSAIAHRPGVPGLTLLLSGLPGLSRPRVLAALGPVLAATTSLGAGAIVLAARAGDRAATPSRWEASVAALLAGGLASMLANGYFASLVVLALLLASATLLVSPARSAVVAAGALLAAGLMAHPLVFAVAAAVLLGTAFLAWMAGRRGPTASMEHHVQRDSPRREAGRIVGALAGGSLVGGAGLLALLAGGSWFRPETSKDGFLRRAGVTDLLRDDYLLRLRRHWLRFALPLSVPLAGWGLIRAGGHLGRLLVSWAVVVALGFGTALATGLAPPERFLSLAYVLPIGAALGIVALGVRVSRRSRALAVGVSAALSAALLAGPVAAWLAQRPFVTERELRVAAEAGRLADTAPPGTTLVFVVHAQRGPGPFELARAANVIRASVPPDRIRDVFVFLGRPADLLAGRPTRLGDRTHDALSELSLQGIEQAGLPRVAFVLDPLLAAGADGEPVPGTAPVPGITVIEGRALISNRTGVDSATGETAPFAPWTAPVAGLGLFALLTAVGLGWALVAVRDSLALVVAPAFGLGGLVLLGVVLSLPGVPLSGAGGALAAAVLGGGGYWLAYRNRRGDALRVERRPGAQTSAQVDQQPDQRPQQDRGQDVVPE